MEMTGRVASIAGTARGDVQSQHPTAVPFVTLLTDASLRRLAQHGRLRPLLEHLSWVGPWEAPGLAQAAQRAGASRITVNRWFNDAVGHTYGRVIVLWRLAEARTRLASPEAAEKGVAPLLGYASASTLDRAFARELGITARGRTARSRADPRLTCPGGLRCLRKGGHPCSFRHQTSCSLRHIPGLLRAFRAGYTAGR
jgi:AraC-like DNA-binding protein